MARWPITLVMGLAPLALWVAVETAAFRVWSRCDTPRPDSALADYGSQLWDILSAPWGLGLALMAGGAIASAALWAWSGWRLALVLWALIFVCSFLGFLDPATWGPQENCQYFYIPLVITQTAGIALTLALLLGLIWQRRSFTQDPAP